MLTLELVWFDDDMLELRLRASNGRFAGEVNFYAALDEPSKFSAAIEGFPRSVSDVREYEFGSTDTPGYGTAKIRLRCKDRKGHLAAQVSIHANPMDEDSAAESASIQLEVLPAAIDLFVGELQSVKALGGTAVLCDVI